MNFYVFVGLTVWCGLLGLVPAVLILIDRRRSKRPTAAHEENR